MRAVTELSEKVGIKPACDALALARSSYYRAKDRERQVDPAKTADFAYSIPEASGAVREKIAQAAAVADQGLDYSP